MVKAVIFDLDGTLLNTSYEIQNILNASLKKFSVPEITHEQTIRYVGNGAKKLVERAAGTKYANIVPEIFADFTFRYANSQNMLTTLYEGEDKCLKHLKSAGINLAILTNKPQKAAGNVCNKFFGEYGFDCCVGQSDGIPMKPDPLSLLQVIKRLKAERDECIFVGDGETDVLTAKNAGVKCISVLWGFRTRDELEAVGADTFANSFEELESLVLNLGNKNANNVVF